MSTLTLWLVLIWQPPWDYATHFQQVNSDDGLSQSTIWGMAQDASGFLWIATTSGLNRYDGYHFKIYKSDAHDQTGLSDNQVRAIAAANGMLWLGTGNGLNRLDPKTDKVTRFLHDPADEGSLSFDYITALLADGDQGLWVGTREGLNYLSFADHRFTRHMAEANRDGALGDDGIRALMRDEKGRTWIATNNGLYSWVDGRFLTLSAEHNRLSHHQIRALASGPDAVWAGTTHGLNRIDLNTGEVSQYFKGDLPTDLSDDWINALVFDGKGYLWIGTRNGGLIHMDPATGKCRRFMRDPLRKTTINANDIVTLFIDGSNQLWAGSFTHGLSKLDLNPRKYNSYDVRLSTGERVREVQALHEDRLGRLWIGMQKGLARWDEPDQPATLYPTTGGDGALSENQVLCIINGPKDRLWIGTYTGGINRYEPEGERFIKYRAGREGGPSHDSVFDLTLDERNRLWAATRLGLDLYHPEPDRFVHIPYPDAALLRQRETGIYVISQGPGGVLWLGTDGGGLCEFNPETGAFRRFRYLGSGDEKRAQESIYSMVYLNGTLWIGANSGLRKLDPMTGQFSTESLIPDLEHATVYSVIRDEHDTLWLSSNRGIIHFDPARPESGLRRFTIADGLESTDYFKNTVVKRANGEILFGGIHGFNGFFTGDGTALDLVPRVVLTSFKVMGREPDMGLGVAYLPELKLKHDQRMFSFEFAALDYRAPEKNRFSYMLEGFDPGWRDAGDRHFAEYSSLPGGRYTFRVKSIHHPKSQPASVVVTVAPPFYQTAQFRFLAVLLFTGLALGAHYFRAWQIRRTSEELEALVEQRSQELEDTRQELVDMAHRTGIYEIADGVLRQIVQQIRDVEDAIKGIRELAGDSAVPGFVACNSALKQHLSGEGSLEAAPIQTFTARYAGFIDQFEAERQEIHNKTLKLVQKADTMKDTISVQHAYATTPLYTQEIYVREMINDALKLESVDLSNLGVKIRKHFKADPQYKTAKVKLMQVLTQVLQNSIEALRAKEGERVITIEVTRDEDETIRIRIEDNGCGMTTEALERAFNAGFSQWEGHSGLGLHESVNAMRETGNDLLIESKGPGQGVAVTLLLR